jgi:hypothetical protein
MMKKLLAVIISVAFTATSLQVSKANQPATMAIIDTAVNSSLPVFKDKIVHEVCILEHPSCLNNQSFMEGPGAASMNLSHMMTNTFNHGNQMAHAAILTNPDIKIVFIRIVGATFNGTRQTTNEATFVNAFNWVLKNKDKYNIQSVAMSQSHHNLVAGTNYCPNTPILKQSIESIVSSGVPVFLPAGNNRDTKRVSWPSCLTDSAIVVSGSTDGDGQWIATNFDSAKTDYFAYAGTINLMNPDGKTVRVAGTSVSVQVASAMYMILKGKNPSYTYSQMIDLLNQKSIKLSSRTLSGKLLLKERL